MVDKVLKKKLDGKCCFCQEANYELLDCHRIRPGAEQGEYTLGNTITVCSNCHRKIHAGKIEVLGKHFSTSGRYMIHYVENGEERFAQE